MAMGWDFILTDGQIAEITLLLSDIDALAGLVLTQSNMVTAGSNYDILLSGVLNITGGQTGSVPEPSIMLLMGLGLAGMVISRRKERA